MSDKKTPREIAKKHELVCEDGGPNYHTDTSIERAIEEFAYHETAPLKQRIQELESELLKTKLEALELVKVFEKRYDDVKEKADRMAEALDICTILITNHESGHGKQFQEAEKLINTALNDYRGIK